MTTEEATIFEAATVLQAAAGWMPPRVFREWMRSFQGLLYGSGWTEDRIRWLIAITRDMAEHDYRGGDLQASNEILSGLIRARLAEENGARLG